MFAIDKPTLEEFLKHYGTPHDGLESHSGRYEYGSGETPYQRGFKSFRDRDLELRAKNEPYTDAEGKFGPPGKTYYGRTAVAHQMGMSTTQYRVFVGLAKDEETMAKINRAQALYNSGMGYTEIGRKMGINESSVRELLKPNREFKMQKAKETADMLKSRVDEVGYIDVGKNVAQSLGIPESKFDQALELLKLEGYEVRGSRVPQPTDSTRQTTLSVLVPPGSPKNAAYQFDQIHSVEDFISRDNGETFEKKFQYPASMDSNRLMIRYAEQGGIEKDGVIEIRRGVPDLSLGESNYSQVRILVDNSRYLKGMALYSDDKNFPPGVDVIFNTNKDSSKDKMDVLKPISKDPDNPFGANIKPISQGGQYYYIDNNGEKKLGLINKRADEGDWSEWKDKVPSQFLSKQSPKLAEKQLKLAIQNKKDEFQAITELNNGTIKKYLLDDFARGCDSDAVHLQAAALPRQKYQVILPLSSMKDTEVYAPNFNDGEKVALVRYPHGGTFEIPVLTVNNSKTSEAYKLLGPNTKDCVVINKNVADRLSGADFDGDTVMVIPTNDKIKISSRNPLKGLIGFDPKTEYGTEKRVIKDTPTCLKAKELRRQGYDDKYITHELKLPKDETVDSLISEGETCYFNASGKQIKVMKDTQKQMGSITNLITDMTIKGANDDEITRAVKHSMVVIDAEKHHLDWKSSEEQNRISSLKEQYQLSIDPVTGKKSSGASTLISRAKSDYYVEKRQGSGKINVKYKTDGTENPDYDPSKPEGALIFKKNEKASFTVSTIDKKTGKQVEETRTKRQASTKMAETDDAFTLISATGSKIEEIYAEYANAMKALANQARKESYYAKGLEYSKSARETYKKEVDSLERKLLISTSNKPRERQAQVIATSRIKAKSSIDKYMTKEQKKKLAQRELEKARVEVGAQRKSIDITDKEWEAIQAGAISNEKLKLILNNTDTDALKERANPRGIGVVSDLQISRIKSYSANGYTNAQIANMLGISASTVSKYLN